MALLSLAQRAQTGGAGLLLHISLFAKLQSWCPVLTFWVFREAPDACASPNGTQKWVQRLSVFLFISKSSWLSFSVT